MKNWGPLFLLVASLGWSGSPSLAQNRSRNLTAQASQSAPLQNREVRVLWQGPAKYRLPGGAEGYRLSAEGSEQGPGGNPQYKIGLEGQVLSDVLLQDAVWQALDETELSLVDYDRLTSDASPSIHVGWARETPISQASWPLVRKNKGRVEKLVSFRYTLVTQPTSQARQERNQRNKRTGDFVGTSVLAEGRWFKIPSTSGGINRLDYSLFSTLGVNLATLNPRTIKIYGATGYSLPQPNAAPRVDDLQELPIWVEGEADGTLGVNDYVLFYNTGTTRVIADTANAEFRHEPNIYSDTTFFFLTFGGANGLRLGEASAADPSSTTLTAYDHFQVYERDNLNLIGSGRQWLGEVFDFLTTQTFSFPIQGLQAGGPLKVRTQMVSAAKPNVGGSSSTVKFDFLLNGNFLGDQTMGTVPDALYSDRGYNFQKNFTLSNPGDNSLRFEVRFSKNGLRDAVAYMDWITVTTRRSLSYFGSSFTFAAFESLQQPSTRYEIANAPSNLQVWDVTDPLAPQRMALSISNGRASFTADSRRLRTFVAFTPSDGVRLASARPVVNQNLHGLSPSNLVIITPSWAAAQAERLADLRRNRERLSVQVVNLEQIYNEFSAGKQDLTAIRDFCRMLYRKQSPSPFQYVLLFGDGSFDYKNRIANNSNVVPIFESEVSLDPIDSYCSDDYITFLDDNEGRWDEDLDAHFMDVAVGRLPFRNLAEARDVVNKLYHYATNRSTFDRWRTRVTLVADDGDGLGHLFDAERVSQQAALNPLFNVNKVYLSMFPEVSTAAGLQSPLTEQAILESINNGSLIVNYSGHGSENQWCEERILDINMISGWTNLDKLPLFITATCDFGRMDDPRVSSGADLIMLKNNGGGIGIITAGRPVYQSSNAQLNTALSSGMYRKVNGRWLTLGEIWRNAKNNPNVTRPGGWGRIAGNRVFMFLGDPSMTLAYPEEKVVVTRLNGRDASTNSTDTLRGLQRITLEGAIRNEQNQLLEDFNGQVFTTVYDRTTQVPLRDGSANSRVEVRNNIIYNGRATVRNGVFNLTFVVPRDITYLMGQGKISFYALADGANLDAGGFSQDIVIGGTDPSAPSDTLPPTARIYLNDTTFASGGMTDSSPTFLAYLYDENGLNLASSGIGHEMTVTLDGNPNQVYVLNNWYESVADDYRKGLIVYPFRYIAPGPHRLDFEAWDVYNNSVRASLDFVVVGEGGLTLGDIITFPNPVVGGSVWFGIDHNLAGAQIDLDAKIYDAAGRLVFDVAKRYDNSPSRLGAERELLWDTRQSDGSPVSQGMYFLRVQVKGGGKTVNRTVKLIVQR